MTLRVAVLVAIAICGGLAAQQPQTGRVPAPAPVAGRVTLPGGSTLETRYYFDHNALARGVRAGRSIVAMTDSGNLLRLDLDSLALTGEFVVIGRATALAAGDDQHVLLGTEDGRLDRVNVETWQRTSLATDARSVLWIGTSPSSIVAVVGARDVWDPRPGERVEDADRRRRRGPPPAVLVLDGKQIRRLRLPAIEDPALAAYGFDGSTLWIGVDQGEFGGSLDRLDLRTGRVTSWKAVRNVRGFAFAQDGAYAYGGMAHFTMSHGYVSRLGSDAPANVVEFDNTGPVRDDQPAGPVNQVAQAAGGKGFWAVSDHQLFRVDASMKSWTAVRSLTARVFPGARFAVANTPTVNGLIVDPERPDDVVVVLGRDGLVRFSPSGETRRSFDGQLEISATDIWATSAGALLMPRFRSGSSPWMLGERGWHGRLFDEVAASRRGGWDECSIAGDDGQELSVLCADGRSPGERALFRVMRNRTELIERWNMDNSSPFRGTLLIPGARGGFHLPIPAKPS